jgi:zinc protease
MIPFTSFRLDNGLNVLVHEDPSVDIAVINILYDVGSRDEQPNKTGFAHLFEHLMFGGSKNIPSYDEPLQRVGGENNAFTSTDITNYYLTVPAANLETAFWLESDRMLSLSFDPNVLEVQRGVVIEEFRQRYLSQPYGDVWLKLRPLAYTSHPYRWATIGKEISHIEKATLSDVKDFFFQYYLPSNAVMVVAGKVTIDQVKQLSEKWFAPIASPKKPSRSLPTEPVQISKRTLKVEANVPANALYKAFHMPGRFDKNYYAADLLGDILGHGQSSRLVHQLVKEKEIFTSINAHGLGSIDPGLLVISGRLNEGITFRNAEDAIDDILSEVVRNGVTAGELAKVKNQAESMLEFGEVEVINRAMNLAFAFLSGDPEMVNQEAGKISAVSQDDIRRVARDILRTENSSVMYYEKQ